MLDVVRAENALLAALIADARPVRVVDGEVTVAFVATAAFLKKKAEDPPNRAAVAEALRVVSGWSLLPVYELREAMLSDLAPAPVPSEDEWVARFMSEFDAEELPVPQPEGE